MRLQSSHLFPVFGTALPLRHVEEYGMGMKLRRGVAIDGPRGVVLESCGDEFSGRLRGMDIADSRLRVSFKFLKCRAYTLPMGFRRKSSGEGQPNRKAFARRAHEF